MKRNKSAVMAGAVILSAALSACSLGDEISVSQTDVQTQSGDTSSVVSSTTTTSTKATTTKKITITKKKKSSLLESTEDIALTETGEGSYTFTYAGEAFNAYYTPDNWKIIDSYKITDKSDMTIICEALSDIHPIHTSDYQGYRTPEDLAYEWEQHNTAYNILPDSSKWKANCKDVDLDPKDQGKSFLEMARDRLG